MATGYEKHSCGEVHPACDLASGDQIKSHPHPYSKPQLLDRGGFEKYVKKHVTNSPLSRNCLVLSRGGGEYCFDDVV